MEAKERARLRGLANGLDTVLHVGKDGVGENLIHQAEITLEARELVKGRVLDNCIQYTPRTAAEALAQATGSEVVQVIGSKFVLYRKKREDAKARRATRTDRPDRPKPSRPNGQKLSMRTERPNGHKLSARTERPNGQRPSTRTERPDRHKLSTRTERPNGQRPSRPNGQKPSMRTDRPNGQKPSRPNGNKLSARTERPAKGKPFSRPGRDASRDNRPGINGGRRKHRT